MGLMSLFSAKKMVDGVAESVPTIVNGISKGIDAAWYTDEEKETYVKDMLTLVKDEYGPRSISRRILAVILVADFSLVLLLGLTFICFGAKDKLEMLLDFVVALQLGYMLITVVIFYFGYYGLSRVISKKS